MYVETDLLPEHVTFGLPELIELEHHDYLLHISPSIFEKGVPAWLTVSFCLFFLGLTGMVFNYKNFIVTMMSIECMYLGAVTAFVFHGIAFNNITSAVYGLLILIFAACESAIGLGLLISVYRYGRSIGFSPLTSLGG